MLSGRRRGAQYVAASDELLWGLELWGEESSAVEYAFRDRKKEEARN